MNGMLPKITVVTPSYNQGHYLEETIASVLGQSYPNLEYMVMDGGSADNSVEIIKKYEKHLAFWVSERDGGQSAAINRGFDIGTGDILAWLNSDDMYLPGALRYIASRMRPAESEIVFGNCLHFDSDHPGLARGSDVRCGQQRHDIRLADYIIQPGCFFSRVAWTKTGPLDQSLSYGFDWEWFIRAERCNVRFSPVDKYLAVYRIHANHKSAVGGEKRSEELAGIFRKYAGAQYAELYLRACRNRAAIQSARRWIQRLRLPGLEPQLLRLAFPRMFRGFDDREVFNVLAMVG